MAMNILITSILSPDLEYLLTGPNAVYFPVTAADVSLPLDSFPIIPHVMIVRHLPDIETIATWKSLSGGLHPLRIVHIANAEQLYTEDRTFGGIPIYAIDPDRVSNPEIVAMEKAESLSLETAWTRKFGASSISTPIERQNVAMVGGGIVNLITAYYLTKAGFNVTIFDMAPNPIDGNWREQGSTFGGMDARIFSLNESRHHHFKGYTPAVPAGSAPFDKTIDDGGWLITDRRKLDSASRQWIEEVRALPQWLAGRFDKDIISFNQESRTLWDQMREDDPDLFEDVGFRAGLLRLFSRRDQYEKALFKERSIGAFIRDIPLDEVSMEFPFLRDGVNAGAAFGAFEVVGFSVNIHRFARRLMDWLAKRGTLLKWNMRVDSVLTDSQGRTVGLELSNDTVATYSHYVLSPGAFGNNLLSCLRNDRAMAAVAGMWITLPDDPDAPLDRPLKITREGYAANGAAEGANVIGGMSADGAPVIHLSSGHGFIGMDPTKLNHSQLRDLGRAVEETARSYFPRRHAEAQDCGMLSASRRYCIRPWTASGLGIFEASPTASGGLTVLTGGHNTGGFAQSPSVAKAVLAVLTGGQHPMHSLYWPGRMSAFFSQSASIVEWAQV